MSWSAIEKAPLTKGERLDTPEGLWFRCPECQEIVYRKDFEANQNVCLRCQHHFLISPDERFRHFLDAETFVTYDEDLVSSDPLKFFAKKEYSSQLSEQFKKHRRRDAIVCGEGLLKRHPVQHGMCGRRKDQTSLPTLGSQARGCHYFLLFGGGSYAGGCAESYADG